MHVPRVQTSVSEIALMRAVCRAYFRQYGPASSQTLAAIGALFAWETGRGAKMWNFNVGNVKAFASWAGDFYQYIGSNWRAYPQLDAGAADALRLLTSSRYSKAWSELEAGDAYRAALELGAAGYYEADPAVYSAGVDSIAKEYERESLPEVCSMRGVMDLIPVARPQFRALLTEARRLGFDPEITASIRTCAQQAAIAPGATYARGCMSWHVLGRALDLELHPSTCATFTELGEFWEGIGGVWGGRWTDLFGACGDPGHFEYHPGLAIESVCWDPDECQTIARSYLAQEFAKPEPTSAEWQAAAVPAHWETQRRYWGIPLAAFAGGVATVAGLAVYRYRTKGAITP